MNTKLLASIAIFALLAGVISTSMHSAYAEDAKKAEMKATKDAKKAEMVAGAPSSGGVTVEMAKGTATNTECADQCYVPSKVDVAIGSTVTWKNVDTAAHTVTDTNGAFDSSLVNAKGSFKQKFDTAGTYNYMCIVHPWMQGTVTVS